MPDSRACPACRSADLRLTLAGEFVAPGPDGSAVRLPVVHLECVACGHAEE
jgi:Zn ribbon nucleic-acid-binding protein